MRDSRERRDDRKIRPIRCHANLTHKSCRPRVTAKATAHLTVSTREPTLTKGQLSLRTSKSAFRLKADISLLIQPPDTCPKPRGILFDLPHVIADASELISARGLVNRIKIESGSFFESAPGGGDVYLLSYIIHDWSEAQCLTILGNCRRAMNRNSRLLIIEMVLPTGDAPHLGKMLDVIMLAIPAGQERTELEYRRLLDEAVFKLTRVVPTESAVSVVEAVPA